MFLKVLQVFNLAAMYLFKIGHDRGPSECCSLLNQQESLLALTSSKKSLIRWGDGESTILTGGSVYFQNNSSRLLVRILKIVVSYGSDSPYLIAMPNEYLKCTKGELLERRKYRMWMKTRYVFRTLFPKNQTYLDAFLFREDSELSNEQIGLLWKDEDVVLFVHSNYKYYRDFAASVPDKETSYIPVFSADSDSCHSRVLEDVEKIASEARGRSKTVCALVSAGPAGKVMVARMAEMGVRSLDMGHYFDYKFYNLRRDKK